MASERGLGRPPVSNPSKPPGRLPFIRCLTPRHAHAMVPPTMGKALESLRIFVRAHWAVLLPAVVYLYIFPYLPELRSPNELCRLQQTRALVDHGTFEINQVLRDFGYVGDLSCVAVARDASGNVVERQACPAVRGQARFSEEHYFPSKAPLLSVAATPVYAVLKAWRGGAKEVGEIPLVFFSRFFVTLLPAVLLLIPIRRFLRTYVTPMVADVITAAYALGSLAFSYAELFMSHQTTGVLLFLCFYAAWRTGRGEWKSWGYAVCGLLAGLSVAAEYTAALALVPLAVYTVWTAPGGRAGKLRATVLGLLGVLPLALAMMAYHQVAFGHPLHSGYKYLNDAAYQGWHTGGFLGITVPDMRALALSFFSPLRGLFALSPFLLLGLYGLAPRFWSGRRPELALSLVLLLLYTYFTSSFSYDSWGWTTGPRHLTPLVPFLLLPAALALEALRSKPIAAGASAALIALSIVSTSVMTFLNYIPDSLTNALYGVAWPFVFKGYLPHTLLSLAGVPNPWAALPALLLVLIVAGSCAFLLLRESRPPVALASAVVLALLIVGVHASVKPRDPDRIARDEGTFRFLEQRILPKPGAASPPMFGSR